jgi:hypothetical protein
MTFMNDGTRPWRRRDVWLSAMRSFEPEVSDLYDRDSWPAWDTAAVLDHDVAPGEDATFRFSICAPSERGVAVVERFALFMPDGGFIPCPSPTGEMAVRVSGRIEADVDESVDAPPDQLDAAGGCSCRTAVHRPASQPWAWPVLLALVAHLRRRRRRLVP